MPLFDPAAPPDWCELQGFEVHRLTTGKTWEGSRGFPRERLLMSGGRALVSTGGKASVLRSGQFLDLADDANTWSVLASTDDADFVRLGGHWGDEIAGCGVWTLRNTTDPSDQGDPVSYPKHTRMDSHYHDYDEYWILLDGHATAVVSGQFHTLGPGDCVAIGAGHHHDMPDVQSPMRAVFFETTLLGKRRLGHLWEHTHGPAAPDPDKS